MSWNTENTPAEIPTLVKCNGKSYNVSGIEGLGLCEKLKSIARENGFSKFDITDGGGATLSPVDIENGTFDGDLTLVRFNVAA